MHQQKLFFQLFMQCFQRLSQDGRENPIWALSFLSGVAGRVQQSKQELWVAARPPLGFIHFKWCSCSVFQSLCIINFFCLLGTDLGSWVTDSVLAKRQWQSFWLFPQYNSSWLLNSRALQQDACCWMLEMLWCWDWVKTLVLTFCWFAVFTLLNLSRCVFGQFWSVHHAHPQPEWLNDMDLQLVSLKLTWQSSCGIWAMKMGKQAGVEAKGSAKSPAAVWRGALIGFISFFSSLATHFVALCTHADWHTPGPRKSSVCSVSLSLAFRVLGPLGWIHLHFCGAVVHMQAVLWRYHPAWTVKHKIWGKMKLSEDSWEEAFDCTLRLRLHVCMLWEWCSRSWHMQQSPEPPSPPPPKGSSLAWLCTH